MHAVRSEVAHVRLPVVQREVVTHLSHLGLLGFPVGLLVVDLMALSPAAKFCRQPANKKRFPPHPRKKKNVKLKAGGIEMTHLRKRFFFGSLLSFLLFQAVFFWGIQKDADQRGVGSGGGGRFCSQPERLRAVELRAVGVAKVSFQAAQQVALLLGRDKGRTGVPAPQSQRRDERRQRRGSKEPKGRKRGSSPER